jgi:hypothetical protein
MFRQWRKLRALSFFCHQPPILCLAGYVVQGIKKQMTICKLESVLASKQLPQQLLPGEGTHIIIAILFPF